jgi:regulatory protein
MRRPTRSSRSAKPPPSIKAAAVRMLARREHSRHELVERLVARGCERSEVEREVAVLEHAGLVSDARYAEAVVSSRGGRMSRRAIARELKEQGVDAEAAATALAPLAGRDEVEEATALWRRRFDTPPADDREKARQLRFLLSRGYSTSIAFKVLRAAGATSIDDD